MAGIARAVAIKPRVVTNGGVSAPKAAAPYVPRVPQVNQSGGANRGTSLNPLTKTYEASHPAAAPGAPGAPPTPYSPAPWDSAYEMSIAGANNKYNSTLLNSAYKKQAYEQEYGLDAGYNDYKSNPYSRAALLQQTYQRADRASGNSLAAGGQLYSGASQNAETYNREHNSQERNALEGTYRRALQGVNEEEAGALSTREEEKANAKWKAIEAASGAELEPDASPVASAAGAQNPLPKYLQGTPSSGKITYEDKKTGKKTTAKVSVSKGKKA